jgi:hypothetical protein
MKAGPTVSYVDAQNNAQILQAAIYAAQQSSSSGCGTAVPSLAATVLIPGNDIVPPPIGSGPALGAVYMLAPLTDGAPAVTIPCYWPLLICGTGVVTLRMMLNPMTFDAGDMFSVESNSGVADDDIGGITFQDLQLKYPPIDNTTYAGIHVQAPGGQNVRIFRVVFNDCPVAVWFQKSLQGSILECTGKYDANTGKMITLGGSTSGNDHAIETYIAGCTFISKNGGTGISLQGTEHARIMNVRLESFYQGIEIVPAKLGPNAVKHSFENVTVYAGPPPGSTGNVVGSALLIEPQGGGGAIGDVVFIGCEFQPGDSATGSATAGVTINPNGGTIDTVRFVSCEVTRWFGNGIEIDGGSNIEITGGLYSACAASDGTAGGIAILGVANGVRITGAACIGSYTTVTISGSSTTPTQQAGIYIDAAASDISVVGCDLSGNSEYGIYVDGGASQVEIASCNLNGNGTYGAMVTGETSSVTSNVFIRDCNASSYSSYTNAIHIVGTTSEISNIQVTNCAGYNDAAVALSSSLPAPATTFHNFTFSYYGPIAFLVWGTGVTHVHIDGVSTALISGHFDLSPGERASIDYSGGAVNFQVLGK